MHYRFFPLLAADITSTTSGGASGGSVATPAPAAPDGGQATPQASTPASGAATAPSGATAINTAPWYSDWLKSDGTVNPASYERMPDHLKHLSGSLKNHATVNDVFTKMAHLETLAGKKGLGPLPENAPPDVVKARNDLMRSINGVPEKPDGYGIAKPADLPDTAWNPKAAESAAAIMHKYNVPPSAAKELVASQVAIAKEQLAAQANYEAQFFAAQETKIKDEFARANVPFDKGMELATRTARTFGIDPETNPIFKNADVILALQKVGVAIGEPKLITGDANKPADAMTDQQRAEDIIHNKSNPENAIYWNGGHPQNKAVKQKVNSLLAEAARAKIARTGSLTRR